MLAETLKLANGMVTNGISRGETVCFYTDDKLLAMNVIGLLACCVSGATYTGGDFR